MHTFKLAGYNGIPHEKYRDAFSLLKFTEDDKSLFVNCYVFTQDAETPTDTQTQCDLKSVVDADSISNVADKSQLSLVMGKYMAKEYDFGKCLRAGRVSVDDVVMFKPIGSKAFGGEGIMVATKGERPKFEQRKYVACKYVQDVQTFKGRKFHLRVYLFVSTWGRWELYPRYRIITAALPYKKGDWQNKAIHDTHLKSTDKDYFYYLGGDMYDAKTDLRIQRICKELVKHIQAKSYPESKAGYERLGLDFLVKESGTPILLEVNNNSGVSVWEWGWYKQDILDIEMSFIKEYFLL